jgi:hypothetical protein
MLRGFAALRRDARYATALRDMTGAEGREATR